MILNFRSNCVSTNQNLRRLRLVALTNNIPRPTHTIYTFYSFFLLSISTMMNQTFVSPRPRPPAKAKAFYLNPKSIPPPPYVATGSGNPSHTSSIPSRTVDWDDVRRSTPFASPTAEEWLSEHSRDDLSELLVKADGLIKQRENGTCPSMNMSFNSKNHL